MTDKTTHDLDQLRRAAKDLARGYARGEAEARRRAATIASQGDEFAPKHADFLHVVARETGFSSWPALKDAVEHLGMDKARAQQRLRVAIFSGQEAVMARLIETWPDLASGALDLSLALYDTDAVREGLWNDPAAATRRLGMRSPLLHLAFSRYNMLRPDLQRASAEIAQMLVERGADVNDCWVQPGSGEHPLSALYGAIGHANNMPLAEYLLRAGANPNDNESLYHSTELGHHEGLLMLLSHGAVPDGTNALFRAMDFDDAKAVSMLLEAGATPDFGETSALHHAARRGCGAEVVSALLEAGARTDRLVDGMSVGVMARLYAADAVASVVPAGSVPPSLKPVFAALEGEAGQPINAEILPKEALSLVHNILDDPARLDEIKRLVAAGMPWDTPDGSGVTQVQLAGWLGRASTMAFFLRMKPDLGHINGFGGTLLSTIIHGSEHAPKKDGRDHLACLEMALKEGVALPRPAIDLAGRDDVKAFLQDWAKRYPGQVVSHGIT